MVMITPPQNIPADLLAGYQAALQEALVDGAVKKRYPWHILFKKQGTSIFQHVYWITSEMDFTNATLWQGVMRNFFKLGIKAFGIQPDGPSQTPPAYGPRTRGWWYNAAVGSGLWYYDYFMELTLDKFIHEKVPVWAAEPITHHAGIDSKYPDVNIGTGYWWWGRRVAGYERWYCVYPPVNAYKHFTLYGATYGPIPVDVPTFIVDVYEITGAWTYNTITWGNHPAPGKLLGSARCITSLGHIWGNIYLPASTNEFGIYLKIREPFGAYFYRSAWDGGVNSYGNFWFI